MSFVVAAGGRCRFKFSKAEAAAEVVAWLLDHGFTASAAWDDDDGDGGRS